MDNCCRPFSRSQNAQFPDTDADYQPKQAQEETSEDIAGIMGAQIGSAEPDGNNDSDRGEKDIQTVFQGIALTPEVLGGESESGQGHGRVAAWEGVKVFTINGESGRPGAANCLLAEDHEYKTSAQGYPQRSNE